MPLVEFSNAGALDDPTLVTTLRDAILSTFAAADAGVLFGDRLAGLPVVPVPRECAGLFANAHERVIGGRAAAVVDRTIAFGRWPPRDELVVTCGDDLVPVVHALASRQPLALRVDADLDAPASIPHAAPDDGSHTQPDAAIEHAARRLTEADRPIVLVGPGVVAADALPGLHALATSGSLGVVNSWGAKGAFDWRSRHHLATAGLQADDLALAGFDEADLVLTVGIDQRETPTSQLRAPQLDVAPASLSMLAEQWLRPRRDVPMPALRERLTSVTRNGWEAVTGPVWPTGVTLGYARALGGAGLVAADPGTSGFWVARTFPTDRPRRAHVPADADDHGFAVACAVVARLARPSRPSIAVVDAPISPAVDAALEAARILGVPVGLEVWDPDGPQLDQAEHHERIAALATSPRPEQISVAPSPEQLGAVLDAAGPIVAWDRTERR